MTRDRLINFRSVLLTNVNTFGNEAGIILKNDTGDIVLMFFESFRVCRVVTDFWMGRRNYFKKVVASSRGEVLIGAYTIGSEFYLIVYDFRENRKSSKLKDLRSLLFEHYSWDDADAIRGLILHDFEIADICDDVQDSSLLLVVFEADRKAHIALLELSKDCCTLTCIRILDVPLELETITSLKIKKNEDESIYLVGSSTSLHGFKVEQRDICSLGKLVDISQSPMMGFFIEKSKVFMVQSNSVSEFDFNIESEVDCGESEHQSVQKKDFMETSMKKYVRDDSLNFSKSKKKHLRFSEEKNSQIGQMSNDEINIVIFSNQKLYNSEAEEIFQGINRDNRSFDFTEEHRENKRDTDHKSQDSGWFAQSPDAKLNHTEPTPSQTSEPPQHLLLSKQDATCQQSKQATHSDPAKMSNAPAAVMKKSRLEQFEFTKTKQVESDSNSGALQSICYDGFKQFIIFGGEKINMMRYVSGKSKIGEKKIDLSFSRLQAINESTSICLTKPSGDVVVLDQKYRVIKKCYSAVEGLHSKVDTHCKCSHPSSVFFWQSGKFSFNTLDLKTLQLNHINLQLQQTCSREDYSINTGLLLSNGSSIFVATHKQLNQMLVIYRSGHTFSISSDQISDHGSR